MGACYRTNLPNRLKIEKKDTITDLTTTSKISSPFKTSRRNSRPKTK